MKYFLIQLDDYHDGLYFANCMLNAKYKAIELFSTNDGQYLFLFLRKGEIVTKKNLIKLVKKYINDDRLYDVYTKKYLLDELNKEIYK